MLNLQELLNEENYKKGVIVLNSNELKQEMIRIKSEEGISFEQLYEKLDALTNIPAGTIKNWTDGKSKPDVNSFPRIQLLCECAEIDILKIFDSSYENSLAKYIVIKEIADGKEIGEDENTYQNLIKDLKYLDDTKDFLQVLNLNLDDTRNKLEKVIDEKTRRRNIRLELEANKSGILGNNLSALAMAFPSFATIITYYFAGGINDFINRVVFIIFVGIVLLYFIVKIFFDFKYTNRYLEQMVTEDNSYLTCSMIISVFFMVIQIIKASGSNRTNSITILFLLFGAMLMCVLTYSVYIKNNVAGIKRRKKG